MRALARLLHCSPGALGDIESRPPSHLLAKPATVTIDVEHLLGRGGFASAHACKVKRGDSSEREGRPAVLKWFRWARVLTEGSIAHGVEARALRKLPLHASLPRLLAVEERFLVTEPVGTPLDRLTRRELQMNADTIFAHVLKALRVAHRDAEVVHRDVRPSNVVVVLDQETGKDVEEKEEEKEEVEAGGKESGGFGGTEAAASEGADGRAVVGRVARAVLVDWGAAQCGKQIDKVADGDVGVRTYNVNFGCPEGATKWRAKQADIAGAAFTYCSLRWPGRRVTSPVWVDTFRAEYAEWARSCSCGGEVHAIGSMPSIRAHREAFLDRLSTVAEGGAEGATDDERRDARRFVSFWSKLSAVAGAAEVPEEVYEWGE
jgi:hypothetical protein